MLVDTHAHLWDGNDLEKVQEILGRAREAGVTKIVVPGDNYRTSVMAVELAKKYPGLIYATVGWYPGEINNIQAPITKQSSIINDRKKELREFIKENRKQIVAIGEIGLDEHFMKTQPELDVEVFTAQIHLALELDLPIVVHNRGADKQIAEVLEKLPKLPRAHFHCFSGDASWLNYLMKNGFYIGLCGNVTYKANRELREVIKEIPIARLLLETDSPYLPPQGKRGEKNEPCNVTITAQVVAETRGISLQELCKRTTENANEFYGI